MKWYEGNIAEAIQKSKQEGAVFGIAIFGDDDTSKSLESSLCAESVQTAISSGKFVCIRISADSEPHRQFSQIYTNAPSPSIYLIGDKGTTLEIVTTALNPTELSDKLSSAWNRHSGSQASSVSAPSVPATATTSLKSKSAQALENANEAVRQAEGEATQPNISLEEKIQRAQKLAAAKRAQKIAQEVEDEKRKEKERREIGKGVSELKRWQEDQQAKQLMEDAKKRKSEKLEELELRRKVKEQIAQDRAARNARSNVSFLTEGPHAPAGEESTSTASKPVVPSSSIPKDYSGQARLQFRLPSGSSISHVFEPLVSLGDVRTFLISNNHVPYKQFSLSVAYPRREFNTSDYTTSLRELGLIPSAALLVLPHSSGVALPRFGNSGGFEHWINLILGYIMIPFTFIYGMLQRALPSTTPPPSAPQSRGPKPSEPTPGPSTATSSSVNPGGDATPAAELRNRKGNKGDKRSKPDNIHRLRTGEDSDEEKATWNGNSTQQM